MRPFVVSVAGGVLLACGAGYGGSSAPQMLEGTIRVTGTDPAPMVVLSRTGEPDLRLVGEFRGELMRLGGAVVAVDGDMAGAGPMAGFTVAGYRIESMGGRRPVVGLLERRDGQWWIAGDESVPIATLPSSLEGMAGAKIWVVGRLVDGALLPQTYGVIRDP